MFRPQRGWLARPSHGFLYARPSTRAKLGHARHPNATASRIHRPGGDGLRPRRWRCTWPPPPRTDPLTTWPPPGSRPDPVDTSRCVTNATSPVPRLTTREGHIRQQSHTSWRNKIIQGARGSQGGSKCPKSRPRCLVEVDAWATTLAVHNMMFQRASTS